MPVWTPQEYLEQSSTGSAELDLTGQLPSDSPVDHDIVREETSPSFFADVIPAAFKRDSEWKGLYDFAFGDDPDDGLNAMERAERSKAGLNYNAYDKMSEDLRPYAGSAYHVTNDEEFAQWEAKTKDELKQLEVLDANGWKTLAAELLIGVVDPSILLPGGVVYKSGKAASKAVNALRVGAMSAGIASADEVLLHQTQNTRTMEESAFAVGGSAILGGAMGAAAGAAMRSRVDRSISEIENINHQMGSVYAEDAPGARSAGAAEVVPDLADKDYRIKGTKLTEKFSFFIPLLQANNKKSTEVLEVLDRIVGSASYRGKNAKGIATQLGMDEYSKAWNGALYKAQRDTETLFETYRKTNAGGSLSQDDFFKAVGIARATGQKSKIPEVNEAARLYDELIYSPIGQEARRLGMLSEDSASDNYLNRIWKKQTIIDNEIEFKRKVGVPQALRWIDNELSELQTKFARAGDASQRELDELRSRITELRRWRDDDGILDEIAQDLADTITGRKARDSDLDSLLQMPNQIGGGKHNFMKSRVIDIDNSEALDFIETDIRTAAEHYQYKMVRPVEMKNMLDRAGVGSFKDLMKTITDDYDDLILAAGTAKEKAALVKDRNKAVELITNVVKREFGTLHQPVNGIQRKGKEVANLAKSLSTVAHLSNTMVVSVGDMGRIIQESSVSSFLATLGKYAFNPKFRARTHKEATERLGILEIANNRRMRALMNLADDDLDEISMITRVTNGVSNAFGTLTGMRYWNQFWKEIAVLAVERDMVQAMRRVELGKAKAGKLGKSDLEELARWGIGRDDIQPILKQIDSVVGPDGDYFGYSGFNRWGDAALRRKYQAALARVSENVIVTPTGANLPHIMSSTTGSMIFQFKSFALAAHTQSTLALAAKPLDAQRWMGFTLSTMLGMQILDAKSLIENQELSDASMKDKVLAGIDYTGAFSMLFMLNSEVERASGMRYGLKPMIVDDVNQWSSRAQGTAINAFGPLAGDFGKLYDASLTKSRGGDLSEAQERQLYSLIPFWRWAGARWLTKQVEDSLVD